MLKWDEPAKPRYDGDAPRTVHRVQFDSLDELITVTEKDQRHGGWILDNGSDDDEWLGEDIRSIADGIKLARYGWPKELNRAMEVADAAVEKTERDVLQPAFVAEHDVAGCEVDVARYLDGTPENMIDYPLREIVKAGKVITLCFSVSMSAAIQGDTIVRRGHAIAALALALQRLGYSLEIWSDWTCTGAAGADTVNIRTLIKGAGDALDAERLMYAVAHPSMLRMFHFSGARLVFDRKTLGYAWENMGYPANPIEDLPEGTIYCPSIRSASDVPDADEQLVRWLRELELIEEEY